MSKYLKALRNMLDINAATLSGAIDIIVVEHHDGSFTCSPFHVRFGKLQLWRSREAVVSIDVNDEPTALKMKLGAAGEAFFVLESEEPVPEHYLTSPIAAPLEAPESPTPVDISAPPPPQPPPSPPPPLVPPAELHADSTPPSLPTFALDDSPLASRSHSAPLEAGQASPLTAPAAAAASSLLESPAPSPHSEPNNKPFHSTPSPLKTYSPLQEERRMEVFSPPLFSPPVLSPPDSPRAWDENGDPVPDVDLECGEGELRRGQDEPLEYYTWGWGTLPVRRSHRHTHSRSSVSSAGRHSAHSKRSSTPDGKPKKSSSLLRSLFNIFKKGDDEEGESHLELDLEMSRPLQDPAEQLANHTSEAFPFDTASDLHSDYPSRPLPHSEDPLTLSLCASQLQDDSMNPEEVFAHNQVTYEQLCHDPTLVFDEDLVFCYRGQLYPVHIALPLLMSQLVFGRPLSLNDDALRKLRLSKQEFDLPQPQPEPNGDAEPPQEADSADNHEEHPQQRGGWFSWLRKSDSSASAASSTSAASAASPTTHSRDRKRRSFSARSASPLASPTDTPTDTSWRPVDESPPHSPPQTQYCKSLRPTQEMLRKLRLRPGKNRIRFSVTSSMRGTQSVEASIFLWEPDAKIVISDVDGTITRSDVLGNLMPLLGRDWSHEGVTSLFTSIRRNGFKIMYLTSRAIGQASITRNYIFSLKQGEESLPEGPVIMSPDRLFRSFQREVVYRRPQEFKIAALTDVRSLFDDTVSPFYAGFGNRSSDVIAYEAVGVPLSRIFIINPKGRVHQVNNELVKSYPELNDLVDTMFPPHDANSAIDSGYSDAQYWRPSHIELNSDDEDFELDL